MRFFILSLLVAVNLNAQNLKKYIVSLKDIEAEFGFQIEVRNDLQSTVLRKKFKTNRFEIEVPNGDFKFRFGIIGKSGEVYQWSNWSSLTDDQFAGIFLVPKLLEPEQNNSLDLSYVDSIEFKWTNIDKAVSYNFEIYQNNRFGETLVYHTEISKNSLILENFDSLAEGKFTWQVTANFPKESGIKNVYNSKRKSFFIHLSRPVQFFSPEDIIILSPKNHFLER